MTYEEFNEFCRSLPATSHVVQWGGAHVWKVGGKVFGIGGGGGDGEAGGNLKGFGNALLGLEGQPRLRPPPPLAFPGGKRD